MSEEFPEMLTALQLAGAYCALHWSAFEEWVRDKNGLAEEEHLSREFMAASAKAMSSIIRQVEIELLAARLKEEFQS